KFRFSEFGCPSPVLPVCGDVLRTSPAAPNPRADCLMSALFLPQGGDGIANRRCSHPVLLQKSGGDGLWLAQHAEQEMNQADLWVMQLVGLSGGASEHTFRSLTVRNQDRRRNRRW